MSAPTRSHGRLSIRASATPRSLMDDSRSLAGVWTARVITLFPEVFPGVLGASVTGKALNDELWALETVDLRPFGEGRHRNVDDSPFGGGAGMVLRPDVMGRAIRHAMAGTPQLSGAWPLVYLSPRGRPFNQAMAERFAGASGMTMICGRFEGMDQRVIDHFEIEEVSLGDFVMTGGEIAAQAILDATVRLMPGVLGNAASAEEESFSSGLLEHPQYTRPAEWQGIQVPEVLTSGDHARIAAWRQEEAERITQERRPDLWNAWKSQD